MIQLVQKKTIETQREKNKITVGWYSRTDMKTELKWNAKLAINISLSSVSNRLLPDALGLRKKIEGAVKVCMKDADNLVMRELYGQTLCSLRLTVHRAFGLCVTPPCHIEQYPVSEIAALQELQIQRRG